MLPQTHYSFTTYCLLTITLLLSACGSANNKETSDIVFVAPIIDTETSINSKSGAFTVVSWEIASEDKDIIVQLEQISGEQDIVLTLSDSDENKAYFNAPFIIGDSSEYQFQLTATNSQGLSSNALITIKVIPVEPVFKQVNTIFEFNVEGSDLLITNIYKVGSYFIAKGYVNHDTIVEKVLYWDDGTLVEETEADSVYLQTDVKLFDINNDGFKDALYLKEFGIEDCPPMEFDSITFVMVNLGTIDAFDKETQLINLGCTGWSTEYSLTNIRDINDDGFLDLGLGFTISETDDYYKIWQMYDVNTNQYTKHSEYKNSYLFDINNDGFTDMLGFKDTYDCSVFGAVCGTLQYRLKRSFTDLGQWQDFDIESEYNIYNQYKAYDIDRDGIDDIAISAAKEFTSQPERTHWFELTQNGNFDHHLINLLPKYYDDIFATGASYFFDINLTQFIKYKYSELLKSPVVDEIQPFPRMDERKYLLDIDSDGDIDVITIEGNIVTMSENSFIP